MTHDPAKPFNTEAAFLLANYTLGRPVDDDNTSLRDKPGVYPDLGVALILRDGNWLLAQEPRTFCARMEVPVHLAHLPAAKAFTPRSVLHLLEAHPEFVGRLTAGEFARGRWYAVVVGREGSDDFID